MSLRPVSLPEIGAAYNLSSYGEPPGERERSGTLYHPDNFNPEQRRIFDHVNANPDRMIMIDAGPGTGKTFMLMTIARSSSRPVYAISYKHDLLYPYRYIAHRYTVTKFMMHLLDLTFAQYKLIVDELNEKMSGFEFISCMMNLLSRARMFDMKNSIVLIDDYTVTAKPLLVLLLTLLKHYKIGTIICGDKNQLQDRNIWSHARCSSFDLASMMADEIFTLRANVRCPNTTYNGIMEYISGFSSEEVIDDFACALMAAIFPRKLEGTTTFPDTHVAMTHSDLSAGAHSLVERDSIPKSSYSTARGRVPPYRNGDKFLDYLPLAIGTKYLVGQRTDMMHAVLENIEINGNSGIPELLILRLESSQEMIQMGKGTNDAIHDEHRCHLVGNTRYKIRNFPIYPANFMTFYKCVGLTIENNLDIILSSNATYQGLYVALTRVRDPDQIVRVSISNLVSHQVSTIVNFDEHSTGEAITAEILESRMNNYAFYDVRDKLHFEGLVKKFFGSSCGAARLAVRGEIISAIESEPRSEIQPFRPSDTGTSDVIKIFIEHMDIFLALSRIGEIDRNVWLHEFVAVSPDMVLLRNDEDAMGYSSEYLTPTLSEFAGFENVYPMATRTIGYLGSNYLVPGGRFLRRVHDKLASSSVTRDWLIEQLNELT